MYNFIVKLSFFLKNFIYNVVELISLLNEFFTYCFLYVFGNIYITYSNFKLMFTYDILKFIIAYYSKWFLTITEYSVIHVIFLFNFYLFSLTYYDFFFVFFLLYLKIFLQHNSTVFSFFLYPEFFILFSFIFVVLFYIYKLLIFYFFYLTKVDSFNNSECGKTFYLNSFFYKIPSLIIVSSVITFFLYLHNFLYLLTYSYGVTPVLFFFYNT